MASDPPSAAVERGLRIAAQALAISDKLSTEIRAKLVAAGLDDRVVGVVLSILSERRLLDDRSVAKRFVERRVEKNGWGMRKALTELRRRGLASELLAEIEMSWSDEGELKRALRALSERAGSLRSAGQASRFLLGRGFDEEVVERAVETLVDLADEAGAHERVDSNHKRGRADRGSNRGR